MEKHALYRDNLTIRDHFAGRALQAMIGPTIQSRFADAPSEAVRHNCAELATAAYAMADAMLAERERP